MKFGFIVKHRSVWPVAWLCEALGVSRSGFHAWLKRGPSARSREGEVLMPAVKASFVTSDRTYGARRIWRDVLEAGFSCGLHKIERLMRAQALRARPRRRALPKDDGEHSVSAIAPNVLNRQFTADQPNRKWIADFTYVWTAEGWLYVAAVIDLFSRRVVGWSMKAEMNAQLFTDALLMAVWRRGRPDALLHHSDRGSQGGFKRSSQQAYSVLWQPLVNASAGVFQPRVLRGLALRVAATAAIVSALCVLRSVPFGKYWRSNPLVFSLAPRCQGLWGSQK
jgi:putative transposase